MREFPASKLPSAVWRLKGLAAAVVVLLLASCSALKLTYNNAEIAIRWKAQAYFDLQGAQNADFRARLARFHAWHRSQELPRYEALARQASVRMADGLSAEDLTWATQALRERYRMLMQRTADEAAPVLATLTAPQLAHLEKEFADNNRKFARKYLSGSEEKQLKERGKRMREQLSEWTGALSPEQEVRVVALVQATPSLSQHRLDDHKLQQQRFLELLRSGRSPEQLAAGLRDLLQNIELRRPPAYAAAMREAEPRFMRFLIDMDKTLTPTQRKNVMQRFADYAVDFHILGGKGAPNSAAVEATSG